MAKITIEELSGSLKEYLNGLGLTEAQVQELIDRFEDEKIGDISQLSTSEKGSLVGAINELFQSANNGKELIASAIGEPLDSNDTFSAMSNDINSLLSTFKTNMMNNGVTIESGDKFKSLIDKIATLADSEGKGIQYASGQIDADMYTFANTNSTHTFSFNEPLNFTPTYLFIRIPYVRYSSTNGSGDSRNAIVSNLFNDIYDGTDWAKQLRVGCISSEGILNIKTVSSSGFVMEGDTNMRFGYSSSTGYDSDYYIDWYAFGVGEEDTTLRDSLASILTEEGVSVTEEDDMASLISKVDEEFDRQVVPTGTAVAGDVLSGKTFINNTGQVVTGSMVNRGGAQTVTPGTSNKTLNSGYYSGNITVQGDSNLKSENIVEGVEIFGITGNARKLKYPEWYTLNTNIWLQISSTHNVAGSSLTVYNNDLYMFGGSNSNNNAGTKASCFDTSSNRWSSLTVLPKSLTDSPIAVTIGNEIYIQGLNYLYCYSPSTNTYTTKANATRSRNDASGATVNGKLYAISGEVSYNKSNAVDMYDPATNTWTTKANKPTAVYYYRAVEENGKIYCAGGYLGSEFTNVMECYDPATNSWSTLANCPRTLVNYAAAALNGEIHIMGGGGFTTYEETNLHYIYNVANNNWATNGVAYPNGYAGTVAATVGPNIYCYGGGYSGTSSYYYVSNGYCYIPK